MSDQARWESYIASAICHVRAKLNGEWDQESPGTGFFVGSEGLMLTAKHVVEPPGKKRARFENAHRKWDNEGELYAIVQGPDSEQPLMLRVARCHIPETGDIAVCQLNPKHFVAARARLRSLALSPGTPRVGERVYAIGYHKFDITERQEEGKTVTHFASEANVVDGEIARLYIPKRDWGLGSFPCFALNADTPHGMSGGPVINEQGFVCGTVSFGSTWDDENPSTCALVGFALATEVQMLREDGSSEPPQTLHALAKAKRVRTDHTLDDVTLTPCPDGSIEVSVLGPPNLDYRASYRD